MRLLILPGLLAFVEIGALTAEDIVLSSGKALKNVEVTAVASDGVTVRHDGGSERVAWTELPAAWQGKLKSAPGFAELRRREAEIEKLKQELARAESDLARLQRQLITVANRPTPSSTTNGPPTALRSEAVPSAIEAILTARDLALDFRADSGDAQARYSRKVFRLKGEILSFDPKSFQRRFDVLLDSGDKAMPIVCRFSYAAGVNAVYTKERGTKLVGVTSGRGEVPLLEVGQIVTIKGRCAGLKESEITFSSCEIVR